MGLVSGIVVLGLAIFNWYGETNRYEGQIGLIQHGFVGVEGNNVKATANITFNVSPSFGASVN